MGRFADCILHFLQQGEQIGIFALENGGFVCHVHEGASLGRDFAADTACLALGGPFDNPTYTITCRNISSYENAGDRLRPSDIPVNYIVRPGGNTLILNTRTAQALEQAGIPRSQWNVVNQTGDPLFERLLAEQLQRNNLTNSGIANPVLDAG